MKKEYTFNGIELVFPVRRAFSSCAKDIEDAVPELNKLHLSIKKDRRKGGLYQIGIVASTSFSDIATSVETRNVIKGLKTLKTRTIHKVRGDKNRITNNSKQKRNGEQLRFFLRNNPFQEAL